MKNEAYNFPLKACKNHAFCEPATTEDHLAHDYPDLRSYVRSISPFKSVDFKSREIISVNYFPWDYDFKFLKQIEPEMDDLNSVRPELPVMTNEELIDWCQQTMNRKFTGIPLTRPFMMSKVMHEKLRELQKFTRQLPTTAGIEKEFMTVTEVQTILNKKSIPVRNLKPKTFENGVPLVNPKELERKKEALENAANSVNEAKNRGRFRRGTTFIPEKTKPESPVKNLTVTEEVSIFKLDSAFARQVLELGKKKTKFFQNLAFSSVFLGKVIETHKNISFSIPAEFKTPLIEQKDLPDYPSQFEAYMRPFTKPIPEDLKSAFLKLTHEKWIPASLLFKERLQKGPTCPEAQQGLAIALERLHCYKLARKWLVEVLKTDFDNLDVFYGLALLSFKLNELGNCIFFCNKVLEMHTGGALSGFYYLLATCHRLLKDVQECNRFYQMFLDNGDVKQSIYASFTSIEWDEQVKSLSQWMLSRTDIPFFRRFRSKQIKKLCANKIKKIEPLHVFLLNKGFSYVVIKGQLRLRDHSNDPVRPKTTWKVHTGQYINFHSHGVFYEHLHFWITADYSHCFILEIPAEMFSSISRETRTNKEIVNMHLLQSFPIFKDFALETLEAIVLESMKIKKCHKGQILRKRIIDKKLEKKMSFGVILSGICDLKREDGIDISYLSRGDCFGEEFIFDDAVGFASLGNLVVKTENLEVGFIPPQDLMRLPDYELQKLQKAVKENSHIKRSVSKATNSFGFHARWHSADT
jgi:hypothetical protein